MSKDKNTGQQTSGYIYQTKRIASRGISYIKRNGLTAAFRRMRDKADKRRIYESWRSKNTVSKEEQKRQRQQAKGLCSEIKKALGEASNEPLFSVVIPLYKTDKDMLRALIDSWLAQTFSDFEICLADASCDDDFEALVKGITGEHPNILYRRLEANGGISANTNAAIKLSHGGFVVFCDHDDLIEPDALYLMAQALASDSMTDVIYTDQDKIDSVGKRYYDPFIKPDYDPYLLCSTNYICHLHAIRSSLLDEIGYLDPSFDGSQDYEITLRACERARVIAHIPHMTYHWRISGSSTADEGDKKLYAYDAGKRAIEQHYKRLHIDAEVSMKEDTYGVYRTVFSLPCGWEDEINEVEIKDGIPDRHTLSELISQESGYILFRKKGITPSNEDCIREMAGFVMAAGANACGAIPDYPFEVPASGMHKVDISTFYLTECPSQSMPVSADFLLARVAALPRDMDFYMKTGWQNSLDGVVYDPYALPVDAVRI